jgi:hypothetical protein
VAQPDAGIDGQTDETKIDVAQTDVGQTDTETDTDKTETEADLGVGQKHKEATDSKNKSEAGEKGQCTDGNGKVVPPLAKISFRTLLLAPLQSSSTTSS